MTGPATITHGRARPLLCTVSEHRRLAQALVLAASFLRHHPDGFALVVVADAPAPPDVNAPGAVRVVAARDRIGPEADRLAGVHSGAELAEALVPFALATLDAPAVYLAPDAWVRAPLELPEGDALVVARGAATPPVVDPGFLALRRAEPLLDWWRERERALPLEREPWADAAVGAVPGVEVLRDETLAVAPWNAERRDPAAARWIRWAGFDAADPHALPGVDLSAQPALRDELDAYRAELADRQHRIGETAEPGLRHGADGTPLDDRLRRLYAEGARSGALTEGPFTATGWDAFAQWLSDPAPDPVAGGVSRFLFALWSERDDLRSAYPDLRDREVRAGFHGWVLAHGASQIAIPAWLLPTTDRPTEAAGRDVPIPWGVNVAGYFQSELGVGEVARRMVDALDRAHVPALAVQGAIMPPTRRGDEFTSAEAIANPFAVNLICVNADGLPAFAADVGPGFFAGRWNVGLWWWELAEFPAEYHGAFAHLDELWVGSRHALDSISPVSPVPVQLMTVPVRVPRPRPLSRAALGFPAGFLFLFTFDYNSVFERKNPLGIVEAFTAAFGPDDGPQLVLKSINAERDPENARRLRTAASRHPHVHLVERHVSAGERDAMLAACDCYVSLHRAEGFGLGLAETMGLGKPVIATGYSGNVDYMDEATAWLVPYTLREVGPNAAPYPPDARWAEPDLDAAARAMREVVEHPAEAAARGRRAATRIRERHSPEVAGATVAGRLEVLRPRIEDRAADAAGQRRARLEGIMAPVRSRVVPPLHEALPGWSFPRRLRRRAIRTLWPARIRRQDEDRALADAFAALGEELLTRQDRSAAELAGLYVSAMAQLRRHDRALEELAGLTHTAGEAARELTAVEDRVGALERDVAPLSYGARAVPYMAGEPLETFRHPVAGEVLGFRSPPGDGAGGYRLFEDVFRGPRERVTELVAPYLPLLEGHGPVLDVGAGRGELLEALRDAGIEGRGVDLDAGMAAGAQAAGVEVQVGDALAVLRDTPEASLGAITAMHVIEHLPPAELDELLVLARTRLRAGGLLVAETINPHATHALKTFWVDPTHQHPVFPEVALIRAAAAGFGSAFVMYPRGERVVERDRFLEDAYALVATA